MITVEYCKRFARYSRWQNQSVYAACEKLSDDTRKRNMGAFFKSIHNTLNHLMVADRLWLSRFDGEPAGVQSLDQVLYVNFDELKKQRGFLDDRVDRYVASLSDEALTGVLRYRPMSAPDNEITKPLAECLMHFFNHGTHHRGQVTTLLMQCGVDPGATDLPWMPNEFMSPVFGV
jgi:uncharacterized damage-inducible protein DinB